jgi:hypothetical protein
LRAGHSLRFAGTCQNRAEFSVGRNLLEAVIPRAVIRDVGRGNLSARSAACFVFAPNENNGLRFLVGQRFQQHGIDHAEDRCVRANAERERKDGDRGEPRTLEERS